MTTVFVGVVGVGAAGSIASSCCGGIARRRARSACIMGSLLILMFFLSIRGEHDAVTDSEPRLAINPEYPGTNESGAKLREGLMGHDTPVNQRHPPRG